MKKKDHPQSLLRSRREFLTLGWRLAAPTAFAMNFLGRGKKSLAAIIYPQPDYSPLSGGCLNASSTEEKTMAAIVDTIVPGPKDDPSKAPGALDTCALNLIYDRSFPFYDYIPYLTAMVDAKAKELFGQNFVDCDLSQRTEVLKAVEEIFPFIRLAYKFVRLSFYSDSYNLVGTNYVGWVGPNLGYSQHADFSFREKLSEELTSDGNLP